MTGLGNSSKTRGESIYIEKWKWNDDITLVSPLQADGIFLVVIIEAFA